MKSAGSEEHDVENSQGGAFINVGMCHNKSTCKNIDNAFDHRRPVRGHALPHKCMITTFDNDNNCCSKALLSSSK